MACLGQTKPHHLHILVIDIYEPYIHIFFQIMGINYLLPVIIIILEEQETKDGVCGFIIWFSLTLPEILVKKAGEGGLEKRLIKCLVRLHLISCSQQLYLTKKDTEDHTGM